ncbi:MAG: hypothetical protein JO262_04805 [Solirubrobacterales bacterium]|nr:hypothetical protein [Solirubrobacterales bacterium]
MRRRICLVGIAIAAVPFAAGISVAAAATKSAVAAKPVVLKCRIALGTVPPPGSPAVDQPPANGSQYGTVHCAGASFGWGVEKDTFKVPDSGDTVGSYVQYFSDGSIRGRFDLTPREGDGSLSSPSSFTSQAWAGTVTVLSGTGSLAQATGKKGVLRCTSGDTVHLTCTEKLKLNQL